MKRERGKVGYPARAHTCWREPSPVQLDPVSPCSILEPAADVDKRGVGLGLNAGLDAVSGPGICARASPGPAVSSPVPPSQLSSRSSSTNSMAALDLPMQLSLSRVSIASDHDDVHEDARGDLDDLGELSDVAHRNAVALPTLTIPQHAGQNHDRSAAPHGTRPPCGATRPPSRRAGRPPIRETRACAGTCAATTLDEPHAAAR